MALTEPWAVCLQDAGYPARLCCTVDANWPGEQRVSAAYCTGKYTTLRRYAASGQCTIDSTSPNENQSLRCSMSDNWLTKRGHASRLGFHIKKRISGLHLMVRGSPVALLAGMPTPHHVLHQPQARKQAVKTE